MLLKKCMALSVLGLIFVWSFLLLPEKSEMFITALGVAVQCVSESLKDNYDE